MAKQEVTTTEIMDFLQEHVATKDDLKDGLTGLEKRIRSDMATKEDLGNLEKHIRADMVTKEDLSKMATKEDLGKMEHKILDAMDDKLADLKGDLTILMRKEDRKMSTLINILTGKKVLTTEEAKIVLSMEPFPQP